MLRVSASEEGTLKGDISVCVSKHVMSGQSYQMTVDLNQYLRWMIQAERVVQPLFLVLAQDLRFLVLMKSNCLFGCDEKAEG